MTESSADDAQKLRRSAEVLRLFPPYSLLDAEENYRRLIKLYHPDSGDNPDGAAAAEINEAI